MVVAVILTRWNCPAAVADAEWEDVNQTKKTFAAAVVVSLLMTKLEVVQWWEWKEKTATES